jgi:hypothetical protein
MSFPPRAGLVQRIAVVGLIGGAVAGCGKPAPYQLVPVSGVVTLDGHPVPHAQVTFVPRASAENTAPGPGSMAFCDDSGKYELKSVRGEPGAVVGSHQVQISANGDVKPVTELSDEGGARPKDPIPARYNTATMLTFDVPAGGTTTADFPLKSKP